MISDSQEVVVVKYVHQKLARAKILSGDLPFRWNTAQVFVI